MRIGRRNMRKTVFKPIRAKGWFTMPRLYAPLEPILDKTWRWNDIEKIDDDLNQKPL